MNHHQLYLDENRVARYREEFPITENLIYLNHAGVSPTPRRFCDAVTQWLEDLAKNGVDFERWRARSALCRQRFASLIGCSPEEIAFVRNTSHGLGLVAEGLDWKQGERVAVATEIEYPSNVHPWTYVAKARGLEVDTIPAIDGGVDVDAVAEILRSSTRLVSVSSAQFGSGAVTDLPALGRLCREQDVLLCVDGIQTVGALPIDVRQTGIHFLSADSHKWMLGTMGIGALFVDRSQVEQLRPVLIGWKSMINGWSFNSRYNELRPDAGRFEEGSPTYALIEGFSAVLDLLHELSVEAIAERIDRLVEQLAGGLEALGCEIGPPPANRRHMVCFTHPKVDPEKLQDELSARRIVVALRQGGIRVSPHFYNTEEEIDRLITAVRDVVP